MVCGVIFVGGDLFVLAVVDPVFLGVHWVLVILSSWVFLQAEWLVLGFLLTTVLLFLVLYVLW